jgi:hypothetical protein
MMKISFSIPARLLIVLSILLFMVSAPAAPNCRRIYSKPTIEAVSSHGLAENVLATKDLSRAILGFEKVLGAGSTTSLRQEDKFVINNPAVENILESLSSQFGDQFILRDQKVPGRKNVTETIYALPVVLPANAEHGKLSAKLRFRKYYTADEKTPLKEAELVPADFVKTSQFVEMKIDHPRYPRVVIKPRMLQRDLDAKVMQTKASFSKSQGALEERAQHSNAKLAPELIQQFFKVLELEYGQLQGNLPLFAKTTYVRDSYSLMLRAKNGDQVEVQFTVDREISVLDLRTGQIVDAYDPHQAVVEVKIPLAYASLSPQVLAEVPGLRLVKELKAQMSQDHISAFKPGAGKLSTFRRLTRQTLDDFVGD